MATQSETESSEEEMSAVATLNKKPRAKNFEKEELEILADQVSLHHSKLWGNFKGNMTEHDRNALWDSITDMINAVGGKNRTRRQVIKKANTTKSKCKNRAAVVKKVKTGRNDRPIPLSALEEKFLVAVPECTQTGIQGGIDTSDLASNADIVAIKSVPIIAEKELQVALVSAANVNPKPSTSKSQPPLGTPKSSTQNLPSPKRFKPETPKPKSVYESIQLQQLGLMGKQLECFGRIEGLLKERNEIEKKRNKILLKLLPEEDLEGEGGNIEDVN